MEKAIFVNNLALDNLNYFLDNGWIVKSVTAQHITSAGNNSTIKAGDMLVILFKPNSNSIDDLY